MVEQYSDCAAGTHTGAENGNDARLKGGELLKRDIHIINNVGPSLDLGYP